jgi:lipopolysaccharide biosynthesis protein
VTERDGQIASLSQAVTERDGQIASLSQAVTERDGQIAKICSSHSWRLTHPLRATRLVVIRVKSGLKNYLRSFWRMLPLSSKQKADLKAAVFRYSPITIKLQEGLSEASTDATLTISSTGVSNPYADDYRARFSFAFNRHGNDFVPLTEECVEAERLKVKVIAFYLPQFHPVPENDKNWGLGFTEWTNVSKATPQFVGHYQPRLPGELGFYDLRLKEIQRRQIELARQHGIHGFCYHHYWFNGKKILDEPFQQVLNDTTLDLPFCLCWANENWTRRWDGGDHEIILAQKHSPEDDLAFFADILPALKDQRYIRIDDKPLLIVYRPGLLPDAAATALRWRHAAAEAGLPGLFIASAATFGFDDYESIGYDGLVQFPPHNVSASDVTNRQTLLNESFSGHVYDYSEYAENALKAIAGKTHTFPCVMMNWDNEARKPGKGHVFLGGTPKNYKSWLRRCFDFVLSNNTEGERLVFVNAWNEWAEGTYLEPDRRYGYAYLHATRDVLRHYYSPVKSDDFIVSNNARFMRRGKVALVVHLYYFDLFDELFSLISGTDELDVFITVPVHFSVDQLNKIVGTLTNVYLVRVENRGRDILPFLTIFPIVSSFGYDYLVKVHSKKSPQRSDGVLLRQHAWKELLIPENVVRIIRAFSADTTLGLISPNNSICSLSNNDYLINNSKHLKFCLERLGFGGEPLTFEFIAGSMFWARVSALKNLTNLELDKGEFEEELGQLDGTMAHAIERLLCFLSERNGYNTLSMEQLSKVNPTADGFPA